MLGKSLQGSLQTRESLYPIFYSLHQLQQHSTASTSTIDAQNPYPGS